MLTCGIKLTHDGGVAVLEDNRLIFSTEMEKIGNNARYSAIQNLDTIEDILSTEGLNLADIDRFVVDGWHGRGDQWKGESVLECYSGRRKLSIPTAVYTEMTLREDVTEGSQFSQGLAINGDNFGYSSYKHVCGHILGTYYSSPFAAARESSYVLVWDGGQYPKLYFVDVEGKKVHNRGNLFTLLGTAYSIIGQYFGPYRKNTVDLAVDMHRMKTEGHFGGYSIAGKIMSYIAKGAPDPRLIKKITELYEENIEISNTFEFKLCAKIKEYADLHGISDEDILLNFHLFIEEMLLRKLRSKVGSEPFSRANLCFSGGSALNIKWNSAIRESGIFGQLYVPPFPNDSGSALGTACSDLWSHTNYTHIDWSVYSGPSLAYTGALPPDWSRWPCDLRELALLLYRTNEPIVFLNGRAELGPRALGNRSILCTAVEPSYKDVLNRAKNREDFRPVAPICLEEDAPAIFDPGCRDPYMLFDHRVRPAWLSRVPAICHLDNTARVQTVGKDDGNPCIRELLQHYKEVSGLPLLCNTSANFNGSGFFPDVDSAIRWGKVRYVWSDNFLYAYQNP